MSEWLTTGQMIDRLKVGEVAECETGEKVRYFDSSIGWIDNEGNYLRFQLVKGNLNVKWRILPNYVSFEEAMKALKEGKKVIFHYSDTTRYVIELDDFMEDLDSFTWGALVEGKWTIEDDTP